MLIGNGNLASYFLREITQSDHATTTDFEIQAGGPIRPMSREETQAFAKSELALARAEGQESIRLERESCSDVHNVDGALFKVPKILYKSNDEP
jgi:hypothetical protein